MHLNTSCDEFISNESLISIFGNLAVSIGYYNYPNYEKNMCYA